MKKLTIILLFSFAGFIIPQHKTDSLNVLLLSDLHICDYNGYNPDLRTKRRAQYSDNYSAFEKFLKVVPKKLHVDEIVTTGDNVDFYDAESVNGKAKAGQIELFRDLCKKSPVPIYLTLGNHEISTFYTKAAKDKNNLLGGHYKAEEAKAAWIREFKCFANGTYYSDIKNIAGTKYLLLFLEVIYRIPGLETDAFWNPEMLEWLQNQLKKNSDSKAVMFFHIPIPLPDNNHDGKSMNDPQKDWPGKKDFKSGILQVINENKNIAALLVGHNHENIIEEMIMPDGRKIPEIQTGSFGENENNWRLLTFKKNMIKVSGPGKVTTELIINTK